MSEQSSTNDLNAMIGNLLSNPAALSGIMNVIGGLKNAPPASPSEASVPQEEQSEAIETSTVPSAPLPGVDALAPLLGMIGKSGPKPSIAPKAGHDDPIYRRRCLLEAIRPYLSPSRLDTLDLLLRILDVLALLSPKK